MRQKKNIPISQSNLENGTSELTESPSAYAPLSISKIKRNNVKTIDEHVGKLATDRMINDLQGKSESYKKSYIDALSKRGYDKNALELLSNQEPQEETITPSEAQSAIESGQEIPKEVQVIPAKESSDVSGTMADKPIETIGKFIEEREEGISSGLERIKKGAEMMAPTKENIYRRAMSDSPILEEYKDVAKGTTKALAGAAETAFNVIPAAVAFQAGTELIKSQADKNESTKWISDAVDLPFSSA